MKEFRLRGYGQETGTDGVRAEMIRTSRGTRTRVEFGNMSNNYETVMMHLDPQQLLQLELFLRERREELEAARIDSGETIVTRVGKLL